MLTSRFGVGLSGHLADFDLASRKTVVAAVSGGGDSTALLLLLKSHLDRSAPATRLLAATVDHRLRQGSGAEAEAVARLCTQLGVEHRSLAWTGRKPATGLSAAAREARHDLLAEAAESEGSDLVLTAHTADDQAETVLMRQARGEGRGLAGIAPVTLFCGTTWFARPLLCVRRKALRDLLVDSGTGWAEDPTNVDPANERARLRDTLAGPGGEARIEAALRAGAEAAAKRRADGESAARLICGHATQAAPGLIRLSRQFTGDGDAAIHAMRILIAVAGGTPHLPDSGRTAALTARIAAGDAFRTVLSRCMVDARKNGVFLLREARGLPEAMPVADGMTWDGRFRICAAAGRFVAPFGPARANLAGRPDSDCPESLARAALAAEPLVQDAPPVPGHPASDLEPPGGGQYAIERLVAPWARYLPSFDLAPARAAAALVGASEIPDPPFGRHNGHEA